MIIETASAPATSGWDIAAALGQVAGAVFTLAAVVISLFLIFRERGDRQRDIKDRREAQARRLGLASVASGGSGVGGDYMDVPYTVTVRNSSHEAMTSLRIAGMLRDPKTGERLQLGELKVESLDHLAADSHQPISWTWRLPWDVNTQGAPPQRLALSATFLDAEGRRWTRAEDNSLTEGDTAPRLDP